MTAPKAPEVRPELPIFDLRRIENIESDIDELTDKQDAISKQTADLAQRFADAFPGGDHVGHCRYHELMIDDIDGRKKLRDAVMEKTVAGLVWAIIVGIAIACWHYLNSLWGKP